jgi:hypothetical protein
MVGLHEICPENLDVAIDDPAQMPESPEFICDPRLSGFAISGMVAFR